MGRKNKRKHENITPLLSVEDVKQKRKTKKVESVDKQKITPCRMDIWYARLPFDQTVSIQGGDRPVLIVSNNLCNTNSDVITVLPMTSRWKKMTMPTHIRADRIDGLDMPTVVLAEQILTIDKKSLDRKIGECRNAMIIKKIEEAICIQLGLSVHSKKALLYDAGEKRGRMQCYGK